MKFFEECKNKKVALCYFGISYKENYDHWMETWFNGVDWRESNYKQTLDVYLENSGHDVDVFLSTYNSPLNEELVRDLKPKKTKFNDFVERDPAVESDSRRYSQSFRNYRFKEVLNLVPPNEYDFVILTRFDLMFKEALGTIVVDPEAVNVSSVMCMGENCILVCDNFYIIPSSIHNEFVKFVNELPDNSDSHLWHKEKSSLKFSYMIEGEYCSHNHPIYRINRISEK
tara:strand:+ start:1585 stop:2268 length:684 start_codon:yes stop_codon:yes gene_type:complete